jgi:triosephosphate isomerase (TIM)
MTAPSSRRTPIVAGNWKMNTTIPEAAALVDAMLNDLPFIDRVEKILCPPFISLETVRGRVMGSGILVGAQNVFWEPKGAYTGEISVAMLQGLVDYVIVGHSERRQYFRETDADVNKKIVAALAGGLRVILCVGEPLSENEAGHTEAYVEQQVRGALDGVAPLDRLAIAYEPIWAIGTGKAATPDGAGGVIRHIRDVVGSVAGADAASAVRILYGGSVTPDNFPAFAEHPEIDGALVGGASLVADSFLAITKQASAAA